MIQRGDRSRGKMGSPYSRHEGDCPPWHKPYILTLLTHTIIRIPDTHEGVPSHSSTIAGAWSWQGRRVGIDSAVTTHRRKTVRVWEHGTINRASEQIGETYSRGWTHGQRSRGEGEGSAVCEWRSDEEEHRGSHRKTHRPQTQPNQTMTDKKMEQRRYVVLVCCDFWLYDSW